MTAKLDWQVRELKLEPRGNTLSALAHFSVVGQAHPPLLALAGETGSLVAEPLARAVTTELCKGHELQRLTRLHAELQEARQRKRLAEARVTELTGRRAVVAANAAPGLAEALRLVDAELAEAQAEQRRAADACASIAPLYSQGREKVMAAAREIGRRRAAGLVAKLTDQAMAMQMALVKIAGPLLTQWATLENARLGITPQIAGDQAAGMVDQIAEMLAEQQAAAGDAATEEEPPGLTIEDLALAAEAG